MTENKYELYFSHLTKTSLLGRLYKRYFSAQLIYFLSKNFGRKIAEIGSGTGSGVLGAFPNKVTGFEINSLAVDFCRKKNLNVYLIYEDKPYPAKDNEFDVCVLDNVLEHLSEPEYLLNECARITKLKAGLIMVVPGYKGFLSDSDHKVHYNKESLKNINSNWRHLKTFSIPFFFKSSFLSKHI